MKAGLAAALVLAPGFALAEDIELRTRIDRVTIHPDGAVVTRIGRAELMQGASRLVLRGLPASIDPASVRVDGRGQGGLMLGAVDVRLVAADPGAGLDPAIEAQLKGLREDKARLEGRLAAAQGKRATIERFAQSGPEKLGPGGHALPVVDWNAVFEAVGTALVGVGEEMRGIGREIADAEARIAALDKARARPPRPAGPGRDVVVAVEAGTPQGAEFSVSYRVSGASWIPGYEARLSTGGPGAKPSIAFARRAEIRQRTGEDWSEVALTLSTARTSGGVRAPELQPVQVAFFEPPVLYETRRQSTMAAPAAPAVGSTARAREDAAPAEPAEQQVARLEAGAYQASFTVPGRTSVPQDGTTRTVLLSQATREASLSAHAAPELEERAYLEAAFVHAEDAPLLAGAVALHRDGAYVGRGRIAQAGPGERVELGFGPDDRLRVTRAPVRRRESEPGWIGQTRTDLREFRTVVKSAHAQPVSVTVSDRVPFSESGAITVEILPQTTAATHKQVGDKRGVLAWSFEIAPGAEKELRLAYRIRWPGDRELSFEPQPVRPGPVPLPRPMPAD